MDIEDKKAKELIDGIIEKRICLSKAEARRLVSMLPEDKIRKRLDRVRVIKIQPETMK